MREALEHKMMVNPFASDENKPMARTSQKISDVVISKNQSVIDALRKYLPREKKIQDLPHLTPDEISEVIVHLFALYSRKVIETPYTGKYLSCLMKDSLYSGHRRFTFDLKDYLIPQMPALEDEFRNSTAPRFSIDITGNLDNSSAGQLYRCTLNLIGSAKDLFGSFSRYSTLKVTGNVGWGCGYCAAGSIFVIGGDCGDDMGYNASDCRFILQGNIGKNPLHAATECTIVTPDRKVYFDLLRSYEKQRGNKVQLLQQDGSADKGGVV